VLSLLHGLSAPYVAGQCPAIDGIRLIDDIGTLLQGPPPTQRATSTAAPLSDAGIVKFFRLIRLARRLVQSNP
jgi:hypothetical protein